MTAAEKLEEVLRPRRIKRERLLRAVREAERSHYGISPTGIESFPYGRLLEYARELVRIAKGGAK